jgi:hypothetical protein
MNLLTENAVYTHVYQIWNNGCFGAATKLQVLQVSQDEDDCRRKIMTKYFFYITMSTSTKKLCLIKILKIRCFPETRVDLAAAL